MRHFCYILGLLVLFGPVRAQTYTLSGYIRDANSGESLIGATVYDKGNPLRGTVSNAYGFYSLSLPAGTYTIVFSYTGYRQREEMVQLDADKNLDVSLTEGVEIKEVIVKSERDDKNVRSTQMGTVKLSTERIKAIPALMGEVDVLKSIQLLPGVLSSTEGSSGFYVRGGGPDQNLILLDEAVVYNSGHMLGFFSVFNADAIKHTTLIKGNMPARYGGRLSSVVDIQMKDGNSHHYAVTGGVGTVSSRLTVEGPIRRDVSSFLITGRRTYLFDLIQPVLRKTDFAGTNYYFYDLNMKVNYKFSSRDKVYASGYFGRDVLKFKNGARDFGVHMPYGNATATLRWNHLFSDKLFVNTSLIYNDYNFTVTGNQDKFELKVFSGVRDWGSKVDFDWFPTYRHRVQFGAQYTWHRFRPNAAEVSDGENIYTNGLKPKYAHDLSVYLSDEIKLNEHFSFQPGLRADYYAFAGPYHSALTGRDYGLFQVVRPFYGLEPRLGAKYALSADASIKFGVGYNRQFVHLVSASNNSLPADVWVTSSEQVNPQRGIQTSLGFFKNFADNKYESSVEVYHKYLWDQIDYPEYYTEDPARDVEDNFIYGEGRSYGIELFVKKRKGQLTGWVGYTLSKTDRIFDGIKGVFFPTTYDRRHDLSLVANYKLNRKWSFGGVFVYGSGRAYTPLENIYIIEGKPVIKYGLRNSARIDPYHRFDLSATFTPHPGKDKRFQSSWNFSVYNVYNRHNPFFIYYDIHSDLGKGAANARAVKVSIFPIIPSITWNFKWR